MEGESIADYVAALRKLASTCEFGDYLDQALRNRLVCGLKSGRMQQKLLTETSLSFKKAIEIATGMEAAEVSTYQFGTESVATTTATCPESGQALFSLW